MTISATMPLCQRQRQRQQRSAVKNASKHSWPTNSGDLQHILERCEATAIYEK